MVRDCAVEPAPGSAAPYEWLTGRERDGDPRQERGDQPQLTRMLTPAEILLAQWLIRISTRLELLRMRNQAPRLGPWITRLTAGWGLRLVSQMAPVLGWIICW